VTLTTSISAPAQIVNGDASMGQQLAQKWCSDCHAVGAEDAKAYGSEPPRPASQYARSLPPLRGTVFRSVELR
jgi:mono/diheme cytochrome c family protein